MATDHTLFLPAFENDLSIDGLRIGVDDGTGVLSWHWRYDVSINAADIATNTADIATNTADIAGLTAGGGNVTIETATFHGILTTNTGAQNTAALQTFEDTFTATPTILRFSEGTYEFDDQGDHLHRGSGFGYCINKASNTIWEGAGIDSTILKLADSQSTSARPVDLVIWRDKENFGVRNLSATMNVTGQVSGTYGQNAGGAPFYGHTATGAKTHNIEFTNIKIIEAWTNPINVTDMIDGTFSNIIWDNCGEGFQLIRCENMWGTGFTGRNTNDVSVGDGWELSLCNNCRFSSLDIDGNNSTFGSAIDPWGSTDVIIDGFNLNGHASGIGLDSPDTDPIMSVHIRNGIITNAVGDGIDILSGVTTQNHCSVDNVEISGCTNGLQIIGRLSTTFTGDIRLSNIYAHDNTNIGCILVPANKVTMDNCEFSDNAGTGFRYQPDGFGATLETENRLYARNITCLNNVGYGVHVQFTGGTVSPHGILEAYCAGNTAGEFFNQFEDISDWKAYNQAAGAGSPFLVTSQDGNNSLSLSHDNTDAQFATDDGSFVFRTTEDGQHTIVELRPKGGTTQDAYLNIYDQTEANYVSIVNSEGQLIVDIFGAGAAGMTFQANPTGDITMFNGSAEGETFELKVRGHRTGDALRWLEIGVGVDADDTASFDGVSNYDFDGTVHADGFVRPVQSVAITSTPSSLDYLFGSIGTVTLNEPLEAISDVVNLPTGESFLLLATKTNATDSITLSTPGNFTAPATFTAKTAAIPAGDPFIVRFTRTADGTGGGEIHVSLVAVGVGSGDLSESDINSLVKLNGVVADATLIDTGDSRLSDNRTPTTHASSHAAGGGDPVKLDDLAAPDDNTDLDVSTTAHGLMPKLSNVAGEYADATGGYSVPQQTLIVQGPIGLTTTPSVIDFASGAVAYDTITAPLEAISNISNLPVGATQWLYVTKTNSTDSLAIDPSNFATPVNFLASTETIPAGDTFVVAFTRITAGTGGNEINAALIGPDVVTPSTYSDAANSGQMIIGEMIRLTTDAGSYTLNPTSSGSKETVVLFCPDGQTATFNSTYTITENMSAFVEEGGVFLPKGQGVKTISSGGASIKFLNDGTADPSFSSAVGTGTLTTNGNTILSVTYTATATGGEAMVFTHNVGSPPQFLAWAAVGGVQIAATSTITSANVFTLNSLGVSTSATYRFDW